MNIIESKLNTYFNECDKHLLRINNAHLKLSEFFPVDIDSYQSLTEEQITYVDQFLFRFAKLQDTIGEKIFKNILLFLKEETIVSAPFIDILNRLEKLGIIESKEEWLELRSIRNDLAHHYDENPEEMVSALNNVYKKRDVIIAVYNKIKDYYVAKSNI